MASVHRTTASSGATKVSVVEYVGAGRYEVLAYLGSSKDPVEVAVLEERAREILADPLQGELDFEIEVPRRVVAVHRAESSGSAAVGAPAFR